MAKFRIQSRKQEEVLPDQRYEFVPVHDEPDARAMGKSSSVHMMLELEQPVAHASGSS